MDKTEWYNSPTGTYQRCCNTAQADSLYDRLLILSYIVCNGVFVPPIPLGTRKSYFTTTCSQLAGRGDMELVIEKWFSGQLGMYRNQETGMDMNVRRIVAMGYIPRLPSMCFESWSQIGKSKMSMTEILEENGIAVGGVLTRWGNSCPDELEQMRLDPRPIITECGALYGIMPVMLYWVMCTLQTKDGLAISIEGVVDMWTDIRVLSYPDFLKSIEQKLLVVEYFTAKDKECIMELLQKSLEIHIRHNEILNHNPGSDVVNTDHVADDDPASLTEPLDEERSIGSLLDPNDPKVFSEPMVPEPAAAMLEPELEPVVPEPAAAMLEPEPEPVVPEPTAAMLEPEPEPVVPEPTAAMLEPDPEPIVPEPAAPEPAASESTAAVLEPEPEPSLEETAEAIAEVALTIEDGGEMSMEDIQSRFLELLKEI
jgi:hypothetical protein